MMYNCIMRNKPPVTKYFIIIAALVAFWVSPISASTLSSSPEGNWIQVDENSHQPDGIIKIYSANGKLYGKIIKAFPHNGKPQRKLCNFCVGNLHNTSIIGMIIMSDFVQIKNNVWGKGKIMDPSSGKIYNCTLTLSDDGNYLNVRGYIGISLFGRSQTWIRQKQVSGAIKHKL
jgi:uncharacterized protein (DUF2147 family)